MNKGLEKIMEFEGQEIKVITDKGEVLINLSNSAKVLGLTTVGTNGNLKIRWKTKGVTEKINKLLQCTDVHQEKYVKEMNYILNEIDESDDRTQIFCSRYLTSMLAMECHNEKAMEYKSFLAKLDESYSKGELQNLDPNQFGMMSQQMQMMAQSMSQIGQAFQNIEKFVADSIISKDAQINDMRDMVGFRDINTKKLSKLLKQHVEEQYGHKVWATSKEYIEAKEKVFEHFDVLTWEQLPITLYQQARTYILTNF